MHKALPTILEIQELDMQMIQLMRIKTERRHDLDNLKAVKEDLHRKAVFKENEIFEYKKNARLMEGEVNEVVAKLKKLETQQNAIKKVEEFTALSQEMSHADRDRVAKEQRLSDMLDRMAVEEETLKNITDTLKATVDNSKALEEEILEGIERINEEGRILKAQRDELVEQADPEVFRIYERLLRNKKDRVVVPIENRCCSGCHIMLTAQDENLVRKGERLVFCEHCSRIHYWQESKVLEGTTVATKQRRRRTTKV
jgi:predicted  nucleic acid-binding Zn-ribbon protein